MRIPVISRLVPLATPAVLSSYLGFQDPHDVKGSSQRLSQTRRMSAVVGGTDRSSSTRKYSKTPMPYFVDQVSRHHTRPTNDRIGKDSDNHNEPAIPPPCHFDDPVDLSVVVSWVEDIFSEQWGTLEDVQPLFYELGMGYTQVAICVSHTQQNIYVTFRGTDLWEPPDVLANLNILWDTYGPTEENNNNNNNNHHEQHEIINIPGKVQRGWNRKVFNPKLYLPLSDKLKAVQQAHPNYRIIIAGHSLGAALSILYGIYVAKYVLPDHDRIQVINLGAPRVGDETFYHAVQQIPNLTIWRLVFRQDIVPRLPPMCLGYRHVGHVLLWEADQHVVKAYHQQLETCMDSECYAGIPPSDWNIFQGSIADHKHDNYKCTVREADKHPDKYWPQGFERIDKQDVDHHENTG